MCKKWGLVVTTSVSLASEGEKTACIYQKTQILFRKGFFLVLQFSDKQWEVRLETVCKSL